MAEGDVDLKLRLLGEDVSASSAAGKVGGAFSKLGKSLGGEFGEILARIGEGFDQIGEHGTKSVSRLMTTAGIVGAGLGAALTAMGSAPTQAHEQLATAIENTGGSMSQYQEEIEKTIKANENFGFSDVETQQSLQRLTEATGDPKQALEEMGVTANIAASRHLKLTDAATMVAKTLGGSTKLFKLYGISVDSATLAHKNLESAQKSQQKAADTVQKAEEKYQAFLDAHKGKPLTSSEQDKAATLQAKIADAQDKLKLSTQNLAAAKDRDAKASHAVVDGLDAVAKKTSGQAAAAVDNFTGRIEVVRTKVTDWAADMGAKLGPGIMAVSTVITGLGAAIEVLNAVREASAAKAAASAAAEALEASAAGADAAATEALGAASETAAAGEESLGAASTLALGPIGLIIAGVALVALGLAYLYQHSETARKAMNAIGNALVFVASTILHVVLGPIALMIDAFGTAAVAMGRVVSHIPGMGGIGQAMINAGNDAHAAASKINGLASALDQVHSKAITVTAKVQVIGQNSVLSSAGLSAALASPNYFRAKGGPVRAGHAYVVGENRPELFIPKTDGFIDPDAGSPSTGNGASAGGGDIHVHITGAVVGNEDHLARIITDSLKRVRARGYGYGTV